MFKKALSILLALMLIVTSVSITAISVSATDGTDENPVYSVAGSSAAMFGAEWDGDNTATEMTFNGDVYEITFEDVAPAQAIQLKVLKNHNWDTSYGDPKTGDNYTFNVTETCDVTVTFDPSAEVVTVTGEGVTQDTSLDVQRVIAVGNGEDTYLNGVNWDPTDVSNEMTKVEDGVYEITMEDIYAFDNYQIKFAINSVDENDEPSANPWAHNFGLTRGDTYATGETVEAAYNGENIIFEVEEDGSVVKATLDLREFDFATKKGAKFTIEVTAPGEATTAPEDTTAAEESTSEAVEETTSADETAPETTDGLELTAKSNLFPGEAKTFDADVVGKTIDVAYKIDNATDKVETAQWALEYDPAVLKLTNITTVFDPNCMINMDEQATGKASGAFSDIEPTVSLAGADFVVATFEVVKGGATEVKLDVKVLTTDKGLVVQNSEPEEAYEDFNGITERDTVIGDAQGEAETTEAQETTEAEEETTEAEQETTEEQQPVGGGFTVNAVSNVFSTDSQTYYAGTQQGIPETVTVTYYAKPTDTNKRLQAAQFAVSFDPEILSFDPAKNGYIEEDEDYDPAVMLPIGGSAGQVNLTNDHTIKFVCSNEKGYKLADASGNPLPIATIVFDVKEGATGVTDVLNTVAAMSFQNGAGKDNVDYIVYNVEGLHQDVYNELFADGGDIYGVIEPEGSEAPVQETTVVEETTVEETTVEETTVEETTVEETTAEPTTEPASEETTTVPGPVADDVYSVAGSSAAIFGAEWDGDNTATEMTLNPDTGLYEITFEDVQPASAIQLKVLQNHNWDTSYGDAKTGDNYTFNVTEACDVTVTIDPETKIVNVTGTGVTQDTELDVQRVIAVGNGEDTYLNGVNWDPTDVANEMTKVADGLYEFIMEDIYAFDNYQIKFAINSVDENDEPSSNPWAHNFGLTRGETYVTGETANAAYNGENIIFEVEEDGSTVKVQLDLREFDFATKQGAKFTITVEAPEEEPTTIEEATTTPAPVGDFLTVNAESNLFSSDSKTYYADGEGGIPETVTVTYYAQPADGKKRLQAAQFAVTFDPEVLSIDPAKNGYIEDDEDYDPSVMLPIAGDAGQVNVTNDHTIKFVCSNEKGYKLADDFGAPLPIATIVFDVKDGATGVTDVLNTVAAMSFQNVTGKDNVDYIVYNVEGFHQDVYNELFADGGDIWGVIEPAGNEPATQADTTVEETTVEETTVEETTVEETTVEETTVEETTVESTTEAAPTGDFLTVNAVSNLFSSDSQTYYADGEGGIPETVTVTFYAKPTDPNKRLQAAQFAVSFDPEKLSFDPAKNGYIEEDEDYDPAVMLPIGGDAGQVNLTNDHTIKFVCSNEKGYKLADASGNPLPIATIVFDVKDGATGVTDVLNTVAAMSFQNGTGKDNVDYIVYNVEGLHQDVYNELFADGGDIWGVIEPAGNEPATQADTTVEETTVEETTVEETTVEETTVEETTVEETTVESTTEAAPTGDFLTVNAVSNLFSSDSQTYYADGEGGIPETVTVTFYAKPTDPNKRLQAAQFAVSFDPEKLSFDPAKNGYIEEDEDYDPSVMLPIGGDAGQVNLTNDHTIKFVCSNEKGYKLADASGNPLPIATIVFDVKEGATGVTDVLNTVAAMSFQNGTGKDNVDYIVYNVEGLHQDVYNELFDNGGDIWGVIEPAGNQPATQADTTVEETTVEETTVAETTVEETTVEETTVEETTVEETTVEETTVEETTVAETTVDNKLHINGTSNYFAGSEYDVEVTQTTATTVTVTYKFDSDVDLDSMQWKMTYDPTKLQLVGDDSTSFMPQVDSAVYNVEDGKVRGVFSEATSPVHADSTQPFVTFTFNALEPGETTVDLNVVAIEIHEDEEPTTEAETTVAETTVEETTVEETTVEETTVEETTVEETTVEETTVEETTVEETTVEETTVEETTVEETTVEETTVAETTVEETTVEETTVAETTVADTTASNVLAVTSTSNMFSTSTQNIDLNEGDTVTVTYVLDADHKLDSTQWTLTYDNQYLQLQGTDSFMPKIDNSKIVYNVDTTKGEVKGAASDATNPFEFSNGDTFVTVTFKALKGGETAVNLNVVVFEEHEDEQPTTVAETTVEETTVAETTVEETTVAETTVEETTVAETTAEPTTVAETTVEPTTVAETTAEPTTVAETTAEPTTVAETTAEPTTVAETTAESTTVAETTVESTTSAEEGTTAAEEGTTAEDTGATSSTDATSATGAEESTTSAGGSSSSSTSDSASGSSSSGSVQTGSASMAIIILLVMVSATAGIYFTRKRREDK